MSKQENLSQRCIRLKEEAEAGGDAAAYMFFSDMREPIWWGHDHGLTDDDIKANLLLLIGEKLCSCAAPPLEKKEKESS